MSSVPHEEDGATLLLLGGARTDHRLQVGDQLIVGLETQERYVELVCKLADLFGEVKVEYGQQYLPEQMGLSR